MKTIQSLLIAAALSAGLFTATSTNAATCPSAGCDANWLNVPGDFANPVNSFTMYLLGGKFSIEGHDSSGGWVPITQTYSLSTSGKQIDFTATQFDHAGAGQGTSFLTATFNNSQIGSAAFLGRSTTLYIDGSSTGSLVDNGDGTGHWTLNAHLYANFGNVKGIDLGIVPLSTNASYAYNSFAGSAMDYHTGLAYMVGQGVIQEGFFSGLRVTIGMQGQDPVAAVPVPAAAWLLGSGLLGLIGVARRKAA